MNINNKYETFLTKEGTEIAFCKTNGSNSGPGVVFLGGFTSNMEGSKASYLATFCEASDIRYLRFDYFGHGASSGKFEEGSISRWKKDVLAVLDELTEGPQILVGSSMGGWLMALAALERPEKVVGLIGIASAPDFVKDLSYLTPVQQEALDTKGIFYLPSLYGDPYPITRFLIEDGLQNCILGKPIPIHCPVRLLHGMADIHVPWQFSMRFAESILSQDVMLTLIKDGDHSLSTEKDLLTLQDTLKSLWENMRQ